MRWRSTIAYEHWVKVGAEILKHYQQQSPPVFLFGLSAGGMLAYQVASEGQRVRGIIATCILDQRNSLVTRRTARHPLIGAFSKPLMGIVHRIVGAFKIPMKLVANMKAIANDSALASEMMKDQRASGASVPLTFLYTMLTPDIQVEPEAFTACPFLLAHPGDDRWTALDLSLIFYQRLACVKEVAILEGAGHCPIEPLEVSPTGSTLYSIHRKKSFY